MKLNLMLCTLIFMTSCASIINGTQDRLNFRSDVTGTKFYLNDTELIGTDTASIKISKKDLSDTVIYAKKDGCTTSMQTIDTRFDATTLLGILIDFGLISILVVDLAINGATSKADRTNYVLSPRCP